MRPSTLSKGSEQRKHRRYDLSLPVRVWSDAWPGQIIETSSKDMSAHGIYLTLFGGLELGTELELEVTLPAELTGGGGARVCCRGKIARIEPMNSEGKIGVGTTIERYEFIPLKKHENDGT